MSMPLSLALCRRVVNAYENGRLVCFQPPYSPEANPIEEMFSKLKTHLRYAKAKTLAALRHALASGFETISSRNMCA